MNPKESLDSYKEDMVGASHNLAERDVREQQWVMLIRRAATGDQEALAELYDSTSRWVYGVALRILTDQMMAEEVTIDVYEQVWRQAASYDLDRGKPLAWLLMLARSRAIDRLRASNQQRQREEPLDLDYSSASSIIDPEEDLLVSEKRRLVQAALASLRPEQREAVELAYFLGLTQSEIAERLQLPLGTVKTRIRLGMIKLRELLLPLQ
jgi:RNA polymerase sigma-70 factor (ECF subfamily)